MQRATYRALLNNGTTTETRINVQHLIRRQSGSLRSGTILRRGDITMLLRSALLFGLASGLCLAGNLTIGTGNPLQDAINRAVPSPFATQDSPPAPKATQPYAIRILTGPDIKQALLETTHSCAIPLTTAPVSKSQDYTVRKYEIPKTHIDDIAKALPMPACPAK